MKINKYTAATLALSACFAAGSAFAANDKGEKAEAAMVKACKADKTYGKTLKDKSASEIAEWVESEERGSNAKAFKKTQCYALHEKWEGATEHHEEGEEHEHQ